MGSNLGSAMGVASKMGCDATTMTVPTIYISGLSWLFWGILLGSVIPGLYLFIVTYLGLSFVYLTWWSILKLLLGVIVLKAMFDLTRPIYEIGIEHPALSRIVRWLAVVGIGNYLDPMIPFSVPATAVPILLVAHHTSASGLLYLLGSYARSICLLRLGSRLVFLAITYPVAVSLKWISLSLSWKFYPLEVCALWFILVATLVCIRSLGTRLQRVAAGRCIHCAYDLRGNISEVCPECGWASDVVR